MTTTEAILERLKSLPQSVQREVLDFVDFLSTRNADPGDCDEGAAWSAFSLASAMRGMEDVESPYTLEDIKERPA